MSALSDPGATHETIQALRDAILRLEQSDLPPGASGEIRLVASIVETLGQEIAEAEAKQHLALQDASEARASFISIMTHELRLPMTSIKGYTDLLRQGAAGSLNDRQLIFLEIIRNNIDRMADLANALSDIARIDSNRMKIEAATFDIDNSLNNVIQTLQPGLREKQQNLIKESQLALPNVSADPTHLQQVIYHLLRNAHMYTPKGGEINILVRGEDGQVRVEISDTGIGIKPEEVERLFDPFFRSEIQVVRDQSGWGLGLYLSSRLLELMHGEIGVRSNPGEGSTFWFTLPAASD